MSEINRSPIVNRIAAWSLLGLAAAYGIGGAYIEYAFSSDPLGPRVFPVALSIMLGALSLLYLRFPGFSEEFPRGPLLLRILAIVAVLILSAAIFEPLGFLAAMFVLTFGIGALFGAPLKMALAGSIAQTILWWFIFSWVLEVYLPSGDIFG